MTSIKPRALTHDDIKWFFEAIGEYGKDFQNMQHYMAQRCGKKADQIRNRDQIRNFYNRLYSKLSQLINLPNEIEKVTQELYLLINYGEIWKKFGFKFDERTKKLLDDLVHNGYTTYRFRNKNVRLRTPLCKALKKINQVGLDNDKLLKVLTSSELPKDVIVEFHPATNGDWLRVQTLSQNPRIRARLSIQKHLSTVIDFLENKWNVSPNKLSKSVDRWLKITPQQATTSNNLNHPNIDVQTPASASATGTTTATTSKSAETTQEEQQLVKHLPQRVLRLKPSPLHDLNSVTITRVVPDSHLDLSFNAFTKKMSDWKLKNDSGKQLAAAENIAINNTNSNSSCHLGNAMIGSGIKVAHSLNTPDASILLERSSTSDSQQPLEKQLNVFQTMIASLEGCENSRTACENTQDRSLHSSSILHTNHGRLNLIRNETSNHSRSLSENSRPANHPVCDLPMPPANLSLGEWLSGFTPDESSRDRLALSPLKKTRLQSTITAPVRTTTSTLQISSDKVVATTPFNSSSSSQNHMIDSKKFAAGWTSKDESTITIGELFLAFKCPEKIILEYGFEDLLAINEKAPLDNTLAESHKSSEINDHLSKTFLFKLLTSASLCLANMQKVQNPRNQPNKNFKGTKATPKIRGRKVTMNNSVYSLYTKNNLIDMNSDNDPNEVQMSEFNNNNNNNNNNTVNATIAPLSSDAIKINQKVEEALKQLKPPTRVGIRAYKNNRTQ